jgi:PAS domain S-box-containing protein
MSCQYPPQANPLKSHGGSGTNGFAAIHLKGGDEVLVHDLVTTGLAAGLVASDAAEISPVDLEDFFENSAVALHVVGSAGTILRANKAELQLLGYARAEYVGRHISEFHADSATIADILARLSRGEKLEKYPARLRTKDGSIRHVEITSSAQFRQGEFVNTRCFTVDVTDLRHARDLLKQKEEQLRQVLDALPAAVYTTDPAGKVTYFNRAAAELAGREPEIGKDEWCVTWRLHTLDGKVLPHDQCPMAIALKENRPIRGVEALAERPDGVMVPFLPFPTPLRDEHGELTGAVNMLVDISERKTAEAQQKLLLAELNHRVKNNLQMLHAILFTAQQKTQSAEARAALADASQRVASMAAAQRLLYDGRNPHGFNADDFLHAVCEAAKSAYDEKVEIVIEPATGELSNNTAMPLALILSELLNNAVKHGINGNGHGVVKVQMSKDGDTYCLSVEDGGPGFLLEEVRKRSSGLSLIVGLARQLGGTFEVAPGPGAWCVVRFEDHGIAH